jgi:hypothetical protein
MKVQRFEDLIAWQKAQDFSINIYSVFKNSKDFGFKDQICKLRYQFQIILLKDLKEILI